MKILGLTVNRLCSVTVLSSMLFSCASTTLIKSEKPGVKVYADGSYLGTTPVSYSDTKIVGSSTMLTLKKEGCADRNHMMVRNEEFQVGACIGGIFVLVPFLWIMGYKPERTLDFDCTPSKP
jgi:hypothetical protein